MFKPLIFANTIIIDCHLSNSKYKGQITLDTVGKGRLEFQTRKPSKKESSPSNQKTISCPLVVHNIQNKIRAVAPRITVVFLRGLCRPTSEDFYSKIFTENVVLDVSLLNQKPSVQVRWLKASHPEECKVKTIRLFDLQLNAKKFQQGTWPVRENKD